MDGKRLGAGLLVLAVLGGAAAANAFDCHDVERRLAAARAERETFDRRHMRELERERKEVRQELRTEVRGPEQLERRNRDLERKLAGWRVDVESLERRAAEHEAAAANLIAESKRKAARRENARADAARKKRARLLQQIAEAEAEIRANQAEIARIREDDRTADTLRSQRAELDRELRTLRDQRRELQREVEFWEWVLGMCRERTGGRY